MLLDRRRRCKVPSRRSQIWSAVGRGVRVRPHICRRMKWLINCRAPPLSRCLGGTIRSPHGPRFPYCRPFPRSCLRYRRHPGACGIWFHTCGFFKIGTSDDTHKNIPHAAVFRNQDGTGGPGKYWTILNIPSHRLRSSRPGWASLLPPAFKIPSKPEAGYGCNTCAGRVERQTPSSDGR